METEDFNWSNEDFVRIQEALFGPGVVVDVQMLAELFLGNGSEGQDVVQSSATGAGEAASVEDALETRAFDRTSDLARECSICMEEFAEKVEVSAFPCSHIFHRGCIFTWLQRRRTCPLCRFQLA